MRCRVHLAVILGMLLLIWTEGVVAQSESPTIEGKQIVSIRVDQDTNLRAADLIGTMGLRRGEVLTEQTLSRAMAKLQERGIFRRVSVRTQLSEAGVELLFKGEPYEIVSLIEFLGEKAASERELRRLAGIPIGSRLDEAALQDARRRIEVGYNDFGHFDAHVELRVDRRSVDPLVRVRFDIDEGPASKLSDVIVTGTFPADVVHLREQFIESAVGRLASETELKELSRELLLALRNEGYLEAYVRAKPIHFEPLTGDVSVEFSVETREPLSIIIEGNSLFSTEELLSLLKMETRTVPFSPNAVPTLAREVERYYELRGYFFTSVGYEQLPPENGRRIFKISIKESERFRINNLSFRGNSVFSAAQLAELIQTQSAGFGVLKNWTPGFLSIEQLEEDLDTIKNQYENRGYYDTGVSYKLRSERGDNTLDIEIIILEPEQSVVHNVEVDWQGVNLSRANSLGNLLALSPILQEGTPYTEEHIEDARLDLLKRISAAGYPNAKVDTEYNRAIGLVRFVATPGECIHLGRIVNQGNLFTRDAVINQELTLQSGAAWNPQLLQDSEQNLYRLGFFRAVSIAPLDGALDSPIEDVVVTVTERDTGSFEFGGDINSEDGLHLLGEVRQRNFQGNGNGLALGADAYIKSASRVFDAGTLRGVYSDPRVGTSTVQMYNELFLQQSIQLSQEFSYDRYGTSNLFRFPLLESLTGSITGSIFRERLYDVPADIIISDDDVGTLLYSMISNELDLDLRDDRFNTSRGYRALLQSKLASGIIGSEAEFVGFMAQQTGYIPLSQRLIWVNNLALQALIPIGNSDEIPLGQRIFLGGRGSLRGFSPNKVGPRGVDGNIVGGDTSLVFNSQFELSITESLLSTLFFDAGQTRLEYKGSFTGDSLSLSDMRYSPGIGLQYKTPIGPIGLEYGMALDREFGERFGRLNFSIGSAF